MPLFFHLSFFFILISVIEFSNSSMLKVELNSDFTFTFNYETKTGLKKDKIEITQAHQHTIIPFSNEDDFTIIEEKEINNEGNQIKVKKVHNLLSFENLKEKFYFYIPSKKLYYGINSLYHLAFPREYIEKDDSIIYQLKKHNIISKLEYTFSFSDKNREIYIGDIPEKSKELKSFSCNTDKSQFTWGCSLSSVYFGDKYEESSTFFNNYPLMFSISNIETEAPKEFLKFLGEKFFKKYVEDGICSYRRAIRYKGITQTKLRYADCLCSKISKKIPFNFVFENKTISMTIDKFFEAHDDGKKTCTFLIVKNSQNKWILGRKFMKNYLTTFDHENEKIILRDATSFVEDNLEIPNYNKNSRTALLFLSIIILLFCLIYLFFILRKKVNKVKEDRKMKLITQDFC